MRLRLLQLTALVTLASTNQIVGQIYKDPNAPVEERVNDLLSRFTQAEKLNYIGGYNSFYIRAIPRLGTPEIKMSDGPVGVRTWGKSTAYPAGILDAATWDTALVRQLGIALGKDCRSRGVHILLAPGMNIYRAPMCGRNFEYFGEDPYLASRMAVSYIRGVQQEGVAATAKHYAANNQEWDRYNVSSDVDERTLQEIYLPAFKAAVMEAQAGCVMSSYNLVNGLWASHSYHLLTDILKNDWGFTGLVMSDWGATHNAKQATLAGLDLEMPSGAYMNSSNLSPLIANGTIPQSVIDDKVRRILRVIIGFGFLDRAQTDASIPADYAPNAEVALNLARGGIVMLKNKDNFLPLNRNDIDTIAVIGANADAWITGGGSSWTEPFHYIDILEGIQTLAGEGITVHYDPGYQDEETVFDHSDFFTDETRTTIGLTAQYFKNKTLSGDPSNTSVDVSVNFNWGASHPAFSGFPSDNFSVRWTGIIIPEITGYYQFISRSDDGSRVYINETAVIDQWKDQAATTRMGVFHLEEGQHYDVRVEYYENAGDAEMRFGYTPVDFDSSQAARLAGNSDIAIVCVGFNSDLEGEGFDRSFPLPSFQDSLVNAVARANPNTIVVLNAGGNVKTSTWIGNAKSLLHGWFTGQEGGTAMAEILFGETNPSGKLPVSFEKEWEENPVFNSYYDPDGDKHVAYTEGLLMGYRYYDTWNVKPLFPFGFGLSYTTFGYSNLEITPDSTDDPNLVTVSFDLSNTGATAGAEVAQLYISQSNTPVERPEKELKAFAKVFLQPGETKRVTLKLDSSSFSYYKTSKADFGYDAGTYLIQVGGSSADMQLAGSVNLVISDTLAPEIIGFGPEGNITFTNDLVEFSISFSEPVFLNPVRHIGIYSQSDQTLFESVNHERVAGLGTDRVSFTLNKDIIPGETYYILLDSAAFSDYYENQAGAIADKSTWVFSMIPSGIEEETLELGSCKLYPNPANDYLIIETKEEISGRVMLEVIDLTGRKMDIFETEIQHNRLIYPCSKLTAGSYLLSITPESSYIRVKGRFFKN